MIDGLNKLTVGHFFYVIGAGAAAGFLFVLLERWVLQPIEPNLGIQVAGPVI